MSDIPRLKKLIRIWGTSYLVMGFYSLFFPSLGLIGSGVASSQPLINPAAVWLYTPMVCSILLVFSGLGMLGLRRWAPHFAIFTVISVLLTSPLWAQQVVIGNKGVSAPPNMEAFFITIVTTAFITGVSAWALLQPSVRQLFQQSNVEGEKECRSH